MADHDGNCSNPYHPDPAKCCEACIFGTGEHADWCTYVLTREMLEEGLAEFQKMGTRG